MKQYISLTEQAVMNPKYNECEAHEHWTLGWRCYRIEYGFECSCPEGIIWLPPDIDPDQFENLLNGLCQTWEANLKESLPDRS